MPDAKAVCDFLRDTFRVPSGNIKCILDDTATRSSILEHLVRLQLDSRINFGDPILIYYAGHGGEARPPSKWAQPIVQTIIPHDFGAIVKGRTVPSIPDRTIGALLGRLAESKGNNIVRLMGSPRVVRSTNVIILRRSCLTVVTPARAHGKPMLMLVDSLDQPIFPRTSPTI